jgi:hypothetical protein
MLVLQHGAKLLIDLPYQQPTYMASRARAWATRAGALNGGPGGPLERSYYTQGIRAVCPVCLPYALCASRMPCVPPVLPVCLSAYQEILVGDDFAYNGGNALTDMPHKH